MRSKEIVAGRERVAYRDWLRAQIAEGLASGDAGELTRQRINQLVEEGIALAKRGSRNKR